MPDQKTRPDLLPWLVLAGIALAGLLGWWLFPLVQSFIANQDCVALGRTNCG